MFTNTARRCLLMPFLTAQWKVNAVFQNSGQFRTSGSMYWLRCKIHWFLANFLWHFCMILPLLFYLLNAIHYLICLWGWLCHCCCRWIDVFFTLDLTFKVVCSQLLKTKMKMSFSLFFSHLWCPRSNFKLSFSPIVSSVACNFLLIWLHCHMGL